MKDHFSVFTLYGLIPSIFAVAFPTFTVPFSINTSSFSAYFLIALSFIESMTVWRLSIYTFFLFTTIDLSASYFYKNLYTLTIFSLKAKPLFLYYSISLVDSEIFTSITFTYAFTPVLVANFFAD